MGLIKHQCIDHQPARPARPDRHFCMVAKNDSRSSDPPTGLRQRDVSRRNQQRRGESQRRINNETQRGESQRGKTAAQRESATQQAAPRERQQPQSQVAQREQQQPQAAQREQQQPKPHHQAAHREPHTTGRDPTGNKGRPRTDPTETGEGQEGEDSKDSNGAGKSATQLERKEEQKAKQAVQEPMASDSPDKGVRVSQYRVTIGAHRTKVVQRTNGDGHPDEDSRTPKLVIGAQMTQVARSACIANKIAHLIEGGCSNLIFCGSLSCAVVTFR